MFNNVRNDCSLNSCLLPTLSMFLALFSSLIHIFFNTTFSFIRLDGSSRRICQKDLRNGAALVRETLYLGLTVARPAILYT